jgi:hypothetical protein
VKENGIYSEESVAVTKQKSPLFHKTQFDLSFDKKKDDENVMLFGGKLEMFENNFRQIFARIFLVSNVLPLHHTFF